MRMNNEHILTELNGFNVSANTLVRNVKGLQEEFNRFQEQLTEAQLTKFENGGRNGLDLLGQHLQRAIELLEYLPVNACDAMCDFDPEHHHLLTQFVVERTYHSDDEHDLTDEQKHEHNKALILKIAQWARNKKLKLDFDRTVEAYEAEFGPVKVYEDVLTVTA